MTVKKTAGAATNPLPISFDQFRKNPVAGVAFLALVGISYMYYDAKSSQSADKAAAMARIEKLEAKVEKLTNTVRTLDSALASTSTELRIINTVKKL
jgi:type II secretory pathway component PulM